VKQGVVFLQGQLPDVIQQLLRYHFYLDLLICISYLVFLLAFILAEWKILKKAKLECHNHYVFYDEHWANIAGIIGVPGMLIAIGGFIPAVLAFKGCLEISLAPKIWLIEYAASLLKN
jgi:predicted ABC-type sugar transport system permease subunit